MNVWFMTFVCILCMITYIYRKARSFQEYHCTTAYLQVFCFMTLQQLWSAWLWKPPALVVSGWHTITSPGPKKNNNHLQRKKTWNPRVIQEIQEIREEEIQGIEKTWGSFGWEDSSSQATSDWSYDPNAPAIFPSAPVATAVIAIAGHGVFSEERPNVLLQQNQDLQLLGLYKFECILLMSVECAEQSGWTWVRHCLNLEKKNTYPGIILSNQNGQSGI